MVTTSGAATGKEGGKTGKIHEEKATSGATTSTSSTLLPYDLDGYKDHQLLQTTELNKWDYPVFDLADQAETTILSLVSE